MDVAAKSTEVSSDGRVPGWVNRPIFMRDPSGWKKLRDPEYYIGQSATLSEDPINSNERVNLIELCGGDKAKSENSIDRSKIVPVDTRPRQANGLLLNNCIVPTFTREVVTSPNRVDVEDDVDMCVVPKLGPAKVNRHRRKERPHQKQSSSVTTEDQNKTMKRRIVPALTNESDDDVVIVGEVKRSGMTIGPTAPRLSHEWIRPKRVERQKQAKSTITESRNKVKNQNEPPVPVQTNLMLTPPAANEGYVYFPYK